MDDSTSTNPKGFFTSRVKDRAPKIDSQKLSDELTKAVDAILFTQEKRSDSHFFKNTTLNLEAPALKKEKRLISVASRLVFAESLNLLQAKLNPNTDGAIEDSRRRLHDSFKTLLDEMLSAQFHQRRMKDEDSLLSETMFFEINPEARQQIQKDKEAIPGRTDDLRARVCGVVEVLVERIFPTPEANDIHFRDV